jgi:hypothetical protein
VILSVNAFSLRPDPASATQPYIVYLEGLFFFGFFIDKSYALESVSLPELISGFLGVVTFF